MEKAARALTRSMMALHEFRFRAQTPETLPAYLPDLVAKANRAIAAIMAAEDEVITTLVAQRAERVEGLPPGT